MKIEIEIPQEFEKHFMRDKFEDALHRLNADAHLIAGNYEQETATMLIKAFKESKAAYDVNKVVERLEENKNDAVKAIDENGKSEYSLIKIKDLKELFEEYTKEQIEIVKSGGIK